MGDLDVRRGFQLFEACYLWIMWICFRYRIVNEWVKRYAKGRFVQQYTSDSNYVHHCHLYMIFASRNKLHQAIYTI